MKVITEREKLLLEAGETWSDLEERFGPGSHGHTEGIDRVHIQNSIWQDHIREHPAILLDLEAFTLAAEIGDKMNELYQRLGALGIDDEE